MNNTVRPEMIRTWLARAGLIALTLLTAPAAACHAQTPSPAPSPVVSAEQQSAVVGRLIDVLEDRYVFPDVARLMGDSLRAMHGRGDFDRPAGPDTFARRLSEIIRGISGDGHLWVMVTDAPIPPPRGAPSPEEAEEQRRVQARNNFGFRTVRILPGNVGYLDLSHFVAPRLGGVTATAAMRFLTHTDAVIVDLRENGGGSSDMVVLLASYFLGAEPVHLFDRYLRPEDRTEQHWTLRYLPGPALDRQPLFILTQSRTFSAPEALAYLLSHQGRATVVGERTAGGANPGAFHAIGDRFAVFVAEASITSPVTGGNWEGTGVEPHVEAPAAEALDAAHRLAVQAILEREADGARRAALEAVLGEIGTARDGR